jgi:hypothetical protein
MTSIASVRVCSMVPILDECDEDARRPVRERDDLIAERIALDLVSFAGR